MSKRKKMSHVFKPLIHYDKDIDCITVVARNGKYIECCLSGYITVFNDVIPKGGVNHIGFRIEKACWLCIRASNLLHSIEPWSNKVFIRDILNLALNHTAATTVSMRRELHLLLDQSDLSNKIIELSAKGL